MRVLFITNVYPRPDLPGRGTFNHHMVGALRAAGHAVDVVVPVNVMERPFPKRWTVDGRGDATYVRYALPPGILRHRYHDIGWPMLRAALRTRAREFRPDVILAFWLHPDGAIAQRLGAELGVPVVPMAGGSDLLVITREPKRRAAVQAVLRAAPAVLTNGDNLRLSAIALGADPGRVHAFRRSVDRRRFHPADRAEARQQLGISPAERLLLFVGNLVPVKGPDILIDALARCAASAPWNVAWIGDGPMLAGLQSAARDAGLEHRMRFAGRVSQDLLGTWYRAADLVALPSRSEGIPNVLLEAMACGTPFVGFDVGGVREIAPDQDSVVAAGDVAALATALERAWNEPRRLDLAVHGEDAMVQQIITALQHAIGPDR